MLLSKANGADIFVSVENGLIFSLLEVLDGFLEGEIDVLEFLDYLS